MRTRRLKVSGTDFTYHVMTRTVNGERLFGDRHKEVLRKMIWQVAEFSGVEVIFLGTGNEIACLGAPVEGRRVTAALASSIYESLPLGRSPHHTSYD